MKSNSKIWIISDTHFGHEMMVTLGYRARGYENKILEKWTKLVKEEDCIIHLGDLAFTGNTPLGQMIKLLPGKKILVRGNHDSGLTRYLDLGFSCVCDQMIIDALGSKIILSHAPVPLSDEQLDAGYVNIHGHLHGNGHRANEEALGWYKGKRHGKYLDVSPEVVGYGPVLLTNALKWLRKGKND